MNFGYLHVTREAEPRVYTYSDKPRKMRMMYCDCECGSKDVLVSLNNLLRGHTMSCGCYKLRYSTQFLKHYTGDVVPKIY